MIRICFDPAKAEEIRKEREKKIAKAAAFIKNSGSCGTTMSRGY